MKKFYSYNLNICFLSVFICFCFFSCFKDNDGGSDSGGENSHPTPVVPSELDRFILENMEIAHIPGLAAGIIKDNRLMWSKGYGWAHIEQKIPVSDRTLFQLASVSKTITLTTLMQVWEEDRFELHDAVNDYLFSPVQNPNYPDSVITFFQLLTHTSSIRDNWDVLDSVYCFGSDTPIDLFSFMYNYFTPGGDYYDETKNFYTWAPAENHQYCNQAVTLSAYMVEAVTGESFDDRSQRDVFDPVGMNDTSWHLKGIDPEQLAMPYWFDEESGYHAYNYYTYPDYPAGNLRSNVVELSSFLLLYMNNGESNGTQVLERDTVSMILTPQVPDLNPNQALIWFFMHHEDKTYIGHGGADLGVRTMIAFRPEDKTGVVLLANANLGDAEAHMAFNSIFYGLFDWPI